MDWLDYELLGNSILAWATAVLVFLLVCALAALVRRILRARLRVLAQDQTKVMLGLVEQVVRRTKGWFLALVALFVAARLVFLTPGAETTISRIVTIGLLLQLGLWVVAALLDVIETRRERQIERDPGAVATMDLLAFVLRLVVWSVVVLLVLDNLGVDITALVAGLGVGGIAVALAAQSILGDLFASLSIVLDKPFVVGDFLIIDDYLGRVEKIGIKTTRLRSLSGEQLVFSNNDLLSSRIRNYGRMFERRVLFSLGVTYQTPAEKLKAIPGYIREAIESHGKKIRFDRAHFSSYGDFALTFEVVYFVLSPDYNVYMDIQQAVNLALFERFESEGIEFAYPTQTLYLTRAQGARGYGGVSARTKRSQR
jgi:small-conductance mechanosensitive channel